MTFLSIAPNILGTFWKPNVIFYFSFQRLIDWLIDLGPCGKVIRYPHFIPISFWQFSSSKFGALAEFVGSAID